MLSVTKSPTVGGEDSSNLEATINCQPDDLIQVRASEFQAMLNQIRDLKAETVAMKETTVDQMTFTLFPKLPLELRLKVWKEALHVEEFFTFGLIKREDRDSWGYIPELVDVRLLSVTGKSNLMQVNKEAREEGKLVMVRFADMDRSTWYNPDTDTRWFPEFNAEASEMCSDGVWGNSEIRRMAIPYRYWSPTKRMRIDYTYREFGSFNLTELVLVLGPQDLRKKYGTECINRDCKPADFLLRKDRDVSTIDLSWEELARHEVLKMKAWKKGNEEIRETLKRGSLPSALLDLYILTIVTYRKRLDRRGPR